MKGWIDGLKDRAVLSLMENIYAKGSDDLPSPKNSCDPSEESVQNVQTHFFAHTKYLRLKNWML